MEHAVTGIVLFVDLDLAPGERNIDFAHEPLAEVERPGTIGLWVGLHGESLLEAGMHHLEGQFDFDRSRVDAATAVDAFMQNHIAKDDFDVAP